MRYLRRIVYISLILAMMLNITKVSAYPYNLDKFYIYDGLKGTYTEEEYTKALKKAKQDFEFTKTGLKVQVGVFKCRVDKNGENPKYEFKKAGKGVKATVMTWNDDKMKFVKLGSGKSNKKGIITVKGNFKKYRDWGTPIYFNIIEKGDIQDWNYEYNKENDVWN